MHTPRLYLLTAGLLLSTASLAQNITPQLKINGFATAGISWLDEDSGGMGTNASGQPAYYKASYMQNSYGRAGISEDITTMFDSVVGIQLDYQVNDSTNLVTQLVAKGQNRDSFKVQADWAYIRYAFSENWVGRAGRLGFPGFMYSDSMLIGHSYPWVRPPAEVYANTPVPSVQGADITYRYNLKDWTLGAQLFVGNGDTTDGRLTVKNAGGLYLTLNNDNLTIRVGNAHGNVMNNKSLAPVQNFDDSKTSSFTSAGVLYDDNKWLFAGEYVGQRISSWPTDTDAGYVTVGHYFGKFLPYVGWAKINTLGDADKTQIARDANGNPLAPPITVPGVGTFPGSVSLDMRPSGISEQTSYTLGLRFDPKPGLSFKAQVEHITDLGKYDAMFGFQNTADKTDTGALATTTIPALGGAVAAAATLPALKSTNLFSLTANVAF